MPKDYSKVLEQYKNGKTKFTILKEEFPWLSKTSFYKNVRGIAEPKSIKNLSVQKKRADDSDSVDSDSDTDSKSVKPKIKVTEEQHEKFQIKMDEIFSKFRKDREAEKSKKTQEQE